MLLLLIGGGGGGVGGPVAELQARDVTKDGSAIETSSELKRRCISESIGFGLPDDG